MGPHQQTGRPSNPHSEANTHTVYGSLAARSEPWADRIYKVRDTLNGRMTAADFTPLFYEKNCQREPERKHDIVRYNYTSPGIVKAQCTRKVFKKGVLKVDQQHELEADSAAIDMLSSFYYMRTLPYPRHEKKGQETRIDIFSGKRKELLTIKYHGVVDANLDGTTAKTYSHNLYLHLRKRQKDIGRHGSMDIN